MKRICCILVCFVLVLTAAAASAVSYNTLPEKLSKQLQIGSGLKGSVTLTSTGETFATPFFEAFSNASWELRGMRSGTEYHYYLYQPDEQEQPRNRIEAYGQENGLYLRSDLLPETVLHISGLDDLMSLPGVMPAQKTNPSLLSVAWKLMTATEESKKNSLDTMITRMQKELENWIIRFGTQEASVNPEDGGAAVEIACVMPMAEVRAEVLTLLEEIWQDHEMNALLSAEMTEEERELYLNGNLSYFLNDAMAALKTEGEVRFTRMMTTMGESFRSTLTLPLDESKTGASSLTVEEQEGNQIYTLRSTKWIRTVVWPLKQEENAFTFWYTQVGEDGTETDPLAVKVRGAHEQEAREEGEEKTIEEHRYTLSVERDLTNLPEDANPELFGEFQPLNVTANLTYSSKFPANSPTTVAVDAEVRRGEDTLKVTGTMKSASPWVFTPFDVSRATEVRQMGLIEVMLQANVLIENAKTAVTHVTAE